MLRLRAGTATLLIGPRSAAGMHGNRYCLDSETDIRQRLTLALQDPASREAMRRFWAHWQSDLRLAGVKDQSIVDRIARMGVGGPLIVFVAVDTSVHRRDTFASRSKQVAEALQSGPRFKPWNGPVKPPPLIAVTSIAPAAVKVPTPVDRSIITAPKKPVGDWTIAAKLAAIVMRAADSRKLPLDTRKQLKEKLSDSKFFAWLVGSLLVWFVSQFVVFGEILDMLLAGAALVLSGAGIFFTPQSLVAATHLVGQLVEATRTARDDKDLDDAADILAEIIAVIGLPVLIAALAHATTRATSEGQKASTVKKPPSISASVPPRFAPRPLSSPNESAQAKTPLEDATKKAPSKFTGGTEAYSDDAVTVRTGVTYATYTDGITINVKCKSKPHVVQFINREIIGSDGKPISRNMTTTGGTYKTTTDPKNPVWNTDSAGKPDPFYEAKGSHDKDAAGLTIFDQPGLKPAAGETWRANFKAYTICDGKVLREVSWTREQTDGSTPAYKVSVAKVSALPKWAQDQMKGQGYTYKP
ncbi:MAG: hypothetical protein QOD89_3178 [Bradyrhizobium sp.]|nr:hypothetical protein [Bradyrhizobium sp.]